MTKLSGKGDGPTQNHINWLIEGRDRNQRQNAALLELLKAYDDKLKLAENEKLLGVAHLLVGTCFSLWRAVFLADDGVTGVGEPPQNIYQHAIKFLEKIIVDNAIGYTQDKSARLWTFGYYVNNACYRLLEIRRRNSGFLTDSKFLENLARNGGSPPSSKDSWDSCQDEAERAIESLKQILEAVPKS